MANFWDTSDGKAVEQKTTHASGSSFDVIPDGTNLLAVIDEAGWKAGFENNPDFISIRWTVLSPAEFKNRKIFQKVKVNDEKASTADNAKRMLMAIDQNSGGKLSKLIKEPEDDELISALVNKSMVIQMGIWEMNDKRGNWVRAVSPHSKGEAKAAEPAAALTVSPDKEISDEDIPF